MKVSFAETLKVLLRGAQWMILTVLCLVIEVWTARSHLKSESSATVNSIDVLSVFLPRSTHLLRLITNKFYGFSHIRSDVSWNRMGLLLKYGLLM